MDRRTGTTKWKCLFGGMIAYGLVLTVTTDTTCDGIMKSGSVTSAYADNIGSSNLMVCSEYSQIKCNEDYAPSLLEKCPTLYCNADDSWKFITILFFGRYEDFNKTTLLWMVVNVEPKIIRDGYNGYAGKEIVAYTMPKTSMAPAAHYFFVYKQTQELDFYCCDPEEKENFNVKKFAKDQALGNPMCGHYFRVIAPGQVMKNSTYTRRNRRGKCPTPI